MPKNHYPVDRSAVRLKTRRDPDSEMEQARADGFYSYRDYEIVALRDIEPQKVWNPGRLERVEEAFERGKSLPPVDLTPAKGRYRYAINDGIHRYNASKRAGFTHIPAIITKYVERPDLKEDVNLDYGEGDFVRFKKPFDGKWEYGYLAELLADRGWTKLFVVIGGSRDGSKWLGDLDTSYLEEKINPPSAVRESILDNWYLNASSRTSRVARRIASRKLLSHSGL